MELVFIRALEEGCGESASIGSEENKSRSLKLQLLIFLPT
jgi:hypothetical protein